MPNNPFQNLLQGWEVKTLGEVCEILDNKRKPINADEREQRLKKAENKFPYYGATGQVGYIDDYLCDFESILLGEDGAPFLEPFKNKAYIVSGKYWVNNHAHILRAKESIAINKFICYFLNILDYMPYVSGTTRLKLNQSSMKQIQIPLPPLETQQKIVAKLESEFAKIATAKSHLEKVKETIPRLKNSLLKSAFSGELTQLCKDEKVVPYRHCEDSSESEAHNPQGFCPHSQTHNMQFPQDSIAESKACKIVDCHELRCNSRNDASIAQSPNLGGATSVAQNLQSGINPPSYRFECNEREESHIVDSNRDISHFSDIQYDKENNLPQGWEVKMLGEITNYGKTTQKCPRDLKPDDWILELEDIKKESGILLNKITFKERQSKSNKIVFYKGDVLFGTLRPYLKKVIIADDNGYCSSEIMPFNSGNEISNHYLAYLFLSDFMGNKIATLTYGTRMPRLGTKNGRELPIPFPPLAIQKQIVEILDSKFAALENLEKETNASLEKLQRLKSSFLNLAFRGELIC